MRLLGVPAARCAVVAARFRAWRRSVTLGAIRIIGAVAIAAVVEQHVPHRGNQLAEKWPGGTIGDLFQDGEQLGQERCIAGSSLWQRSANAQFVERLCRRHDHGGARCSAVPIVVPLEQEHEPDKKGFLGRCEGIEVDFSIPVPRRRCLWDPAPASRSLGRLVIVPKDNASADLWVMTV